MDPISLLIGRRSVAPDALDDPAPSDTDIDTILRSAVAAPDHGGLMPWRFILIRGEARRRLGELFAEATQARDPAADADTLAKQASKPLRAPLIIAVAARIDVDNPKIPAVEQLLSAGAAAQQIQLAATALGYGAIWLTGANAHDSAVVEALGLDLDDRIVGLLHIGTPSDPGATPQRPDPWDFTTEWTEPVTYETL
jgi:nitroreductase